MRGDELDVIKISIHAPVKGATVEEGVQFILAQISIHAPVKGATTRQPCRIN